MLFKSPLLKSTVAVRDVKLHSPTFITVCWQVVHLNFYLVIVHSVKIMFAAKALRIVINVESDSTTANQKENDTLETVEIEESQKQMLDEGSVCRYLLTT